VVPFAALNPYQHNLLDELRRCTGELGMRGLKVHSMIQGAHSPNLRSPAFDWDAVWRYCGEHHLPILAHGVVTEDDIRRHPETVFVIAHGIGAPELMARLRDCPNAHVDTAWTQTKDWSLRAIVGLIGAERVLWGTDAPVDDFAQRLGVVLDSGLSDAEQRQILGLNAARLLGGQG
jgi:predicted TIM-barrel fold metal-dependent hydrolase